MDDLVACSPCRSRGMMRCPKVGTSPHSEWAYCARRCSSIRLRRLNIMVADKLTVECRWERRGKLDTKNLSGVGPLRLYGYWLRVMVRDTAYRKAAWLTYTIGLGWLFIGRFLSRPPISDMENSCPRGRGHIIRTGVCKITIIPHGLTGTSCTRGTPLVPHRDGTNRRAYTVHLVARSITVQPTESLCSLRDYCNLN